MDAHKTLLMTCFEPFGGRETNVSREAVMALPPTIGPFELRRACLPVAFGRAAELAAQAADELCPAAIVCVGEAAGRTAITPEATARNLRDARIPDNDGAQPHGEPVLAGGPDELCSTLPIDAIVEAILSVGVPAEVSHNAGTFVCNDLMYLTLHRFGQGDIPCGFVHVPAGGELDIPTIARGLQATVLSLAKRWGDREGTVPLSHPRST